MMTATFFIPIFTACDDVIFYKSLPDLLFLFTYVTDKTLHLLHKWTMHNIAVQISIMEQHSQHCIYRHGDGEHLY